MKQYSGKLVGFLCAIVVLLVAVLGVQTAYLVWLHRELYQAVAQAGTGLDDLGKLLTTDVGGVTSHVERPGEGTSLDKAPGGSIDSIIPKGLGSVGDVQKLDDSLRKMLGDVMADPNLRSVLKDLNMDDLLGAPQSPDRPALPQPRSVQPEPAPPAGSEFHPVFGFEEAGDRYVVTVDLPGVPESEVFAHIEDGALVVSGKHSGQPFSEAFAFPGPIQPNSERIDYKDGRLTVTVKKKAGIGSPAAV